MVVAARACPSSQQPLPLPMQHPDHINRPLSQPLQALSQATSSLAACLKEYTAPTSSWPSLPYPTLHPYTWGEGTGEGAESGAYAPRVKAARWLQMWLAASHPPEHTAYSCCPLQVAAGQPECHTCHSPVCHRLRICNSRPMRGGILCSSSHMHCQTAPRARCLPAAPGTARLQRWQGGRGVSRGGDRGGYTGGYGGSNRSGYRGGNRGGMPRPQFARTARQ